MGPVAPPQAGRTERDNGAARDNRTTARNRLAGLAVNLEVGPVALGHLEHIAGARNCIDFEPAPDCADRLADGGHRAVEAVVADINAAPAAVEQGLAGNDLSGRIGEDGEHLHDARFDVDRAERATQGPGRRADDYAPERQVRPCRKLGRGQQRLSHGLLGNVHPLARGSPQMIAKSSADRQMIIIAHAVPGFYALLLPAKRRFPGRSRQWRRM